jgi:hypothetical protein
MPNCSRFSLNVSRFESIYINFDDKQPPRVASSSPDLSCFSEALLIRRCSQGFIGGEIENQAVRHEARVTLDTCMAGDLATKTIVIRRQPLEGECV